MPVEAGPETIRPLTRGNYAFFQGNHTISQGRELLLAQLLAHLLVQLLLQLLLQLLVPILPELLLQLLIQLLLQLKAGTTPVAMGLGPVCISRGKEPHILQLVAQIFEQLVMQFQVHPIVELLLHVLVALLVELLIQLLVQLLPSQSCLPRAPDWKRR